MKEIILAQNTRDYDGNKSAPNEQIPVTEAARSDVNGGSVAIATWAVPLAIAIALVIYYFVKSRSSFRRSFRH